jgi:uncharacterized protein
MADIIRKGIEFDIETKAANEEVGEFVGVASSSDKDLTGDIIEPHAFGVVNARSIPLLRDHDPRQIIGGWKSIEYTEGGTKLKVAGEIGLSDSIPRGRETFELLKRGWLNGISVGFRCTETPVMDEVKKVRRIKSALLLECSLVAIPANPHARVRNVKSFTRPDLAEWLTEYGLSGDDINTVMTRGFDALCGFELPPRKLITEIDGHPAKDPTDTIVTAVRGLLTSMRGQSHADH